MNRQLTYTRWRVDAGFTLLELLIATAVTVFLITLLAVIINESNRIWLQGLAQREAHSGARAMRQFLVSDIQHAALPADFQQRRADWVEAWTKYRLSPGGSAPPPADTNSSPQFLLNQPNPHGSGGFPEYMNPGMVFLGGPSRSGGQPGLSAEFGYFVKWSTPAGGNGTSATLNRFFGIGFPKDPSSSSYTNYLMYRSPSAWLSKSIVDAVSPGPAIDSRGVLLEHAVALWIRALDPEGKPILADASGTATGYAFDSRRGYSYTNAAGVLVRMPPPALPSAVELCVLTLDSKAAGRLTSPLNTYNAGNPTNFNQEIAAYRASLDPNVDRSLREFRAVVRLLNAK
ncbi:MAG: PulJ/GspJ family protein [Terrimicrobiaceae bacterium]